MSKILYDLKEVIYFNYSKKGYFVKSCLKSLEN